MVLKLSNNTVLKRQSHLNGWFEETLPIIHHSPPHIQHICKQLTNPGTDTVYICYWEMTETHVDVIYNINMM